MLRVRWPIGRAVRSERRPPRQSATGVTIARPTRPRQNMTPAVDMSAESSRPATASPTKLATVASIHKAPFTPFVSTRAGFPFTAPPVAPPPSYTRGIGRGSGAPLLSSQPASRALALVGVEVALAQADRLRRHLD